MAKFKVMTRDHGEFEIEADEYVVSDTAATFRKGADKVAYVPIHSVLAILTGDVR